VKADVREGLGWLIHHPVLRNLAVVSAGMAFCNQIAQATLVLYALEVLDVPEAAFGLFAMTAAVGAVLGAVSAPGLSRRFGRTTVMATAAVVQPFVLLAMALAGNAILAAAVFTIYAGLVGLWNVLSVSLRQQLIPTHIFGRVHGAWRTIVWGALPLGSWLGGLIAAEYGLRAPWVVGAVLFALVSALGISTLRRVGHLTAATAGSPADQPLADQPPAVVADAESPALANTGSSASP
jgi:MFS family permease